MGLKPEIEQVTESTTVPKTSTQIVAEHIDQVDTVAERIDNGQIDSVDNNATDITTVALNIGDVQKAGTNIQDITALAGSLSNITDVADNLGSVNNVNNNMVPLLVLYVRMASLLDIELAIPNIDTVALNMDSVLAVESNIPEITTLVSHMEDIVYVADNKDNLEVIFNNLTNIISVGTNELNINTVADNMATIIEVSVYMQELQDNLTAITTMEANVVALESSTQIAKDETIAAKDITVSNAASTAADRNTVAAKAAAMELLFDTFDDRYLGQKAVDPTVDNDGDSLIAGTVYFNTTTNTTRFYTGAIWEDPDVSSTNAASAALASQLAAAISEANANDSAVSANSDAGIASNSANSASGSATMAIEQATIATTKAAEASSSEANASASEDVAKLSETNSATSAGIASSAATTATAQAVIATDKATEVSGALAGKLDVGATAVNSDKLDNIDSSGFQQIPVANIPAPLGGYLISGGGESSVVGALKVQLPQGNIGAMVAFTINVYNYKLGSSFQIRIGGQVSSSWLECSSHIISGSNTVRVRFGFDGERYCVYLGDNTTTWNYVQVTITNTMAGYSSAGPELWSTGWSITTGATAENVDYDITLNDWDGVDYVDPDAIGDNATAKIFPDGSIVGSTDNGSYTKWPNGKVEVTSHATWILTSTGTRYFRSWVFPVSFIENPIVGLNLPVDTLSWSAGASERAKVSFTTGMFTLGLNACMLSAEVVEGQAFSVGGTVSGIGAIATGRWK